MENEFQLSRGEGLGWRDNWVYYLAILFPDQMSYFVDDFYRDYLNRDEENNARYK